MVSTASTAAQANEVEKKRKQTLERAKANHLSRQLQMRLQYARLKVEHGWQRQNLNEVENLYFHHSHQRGPKSSAPSHAFTSTQTDHPMLTFASPRYSDTSCKSWLQPQSRSSTLDALPENPSQGRSSTAGNSTSDPPTLAVSHLPTLDGSSNILRTSSTASTPPEVQITYPPQNPLTPAQTPESQIGPSLQDEKPNPGTPAPPSKPHVVTSASVLETSSSFSSTSFPQSQPTRSLPFTSGGTSFTPVSPAPTSMTLSNTNAVSFGSKGNPPSMSKDLFGSNATTLTYDSFWSGLQSKSYPGLKSGGQAVAFGQTSGSLRQSQSTTSLSTPISTTSVSPVVSMQNLSSMPTSTSIPSPMIPPQTQAITPSSPSVSLSVPSATTPVPISPISPSLSGLVPVATPPPVPGSPPGQPISPHVQMTLPNRYLSDNIVPWPFVPTSHTPLQQPGQSQHHHLIPTSLLANPAAFPFLANLSASYAQAFGVIPTPVHGTPSAGVSAPESGVGQATSGAGPPSTIPMSPSAPPVVSACVGQQEG